MMDLSRYGVKDVLSKKIARLVWAGPHPQIAACAHACQVGIWTGQAFEGSGSHKCDRIVADADFYIN